MASYSYSSESYSSGEPIQYDETIALGDAGSSSIQYSAAAGGASALAAGFSDGGIIATSGQAARTTNRIASDLLALNGAGASSAGGAIEFSSYSAGGADYADAGAYSSSSGGAIISSSAGAIGGGIAISGGGAASAGNQIYLSEVEQSIIRSSNPISIQEAEEITVNGQRGIWANRAEVVNWRGPIPITQYLINEDASPEIITKRSNQTLDYVQELAIRYLRPPTPPAPGEIIIQQQSNTLTPPAPPLIIRQQPPRPPTPEPLVIREAPPQPPSQVGRKVITISGKRLPPPPRKVIIERLAPLPAKPQSVIVERWLPYAQTKRRVIFQRAAQVDPVIVKPRNVIVQWEAPRVNIRREIKYLGVIRANPAEYVQRYGATLKGATDMPDYISNIKTPEGLVLAANYRYNNLHELEGDLQALRLVDLDREGLSEYRSYLSRLGISYDPRAAGAALISSSAISSSGASYGGAAYLDAGASSAAASGATIISSGSGANARLIEEIFQSINSNGDDRIQIEEAERALIRLNSRLGRNYGEEDVKAFFAALDVNRDGTLSYDEFKRAFYRIIG